MLASVLQCLFSYWAAVYILKGQFSWKDITMKVNLNRPFPSNSCYHFPLSTQKQAVTTYSITTEILQNICHQSPLEKRFSSTARYVQTFMWSDLGIAALTSNSAHRWHHGVPSRLYETHCTFITFYNCRSY